MGIRAFKAKSGLVMETEDDFRIVPPKTTQGSLSTFEQFLHIKDITNEVFAHLLLVDLSQMRICSKSLYQSIEEHCKSRCCRISRVESLDPFSSWYGLMTGRFNFHMKFDRKRTKGGKLLRENTLFVVCFFSVFVFFSIFFGLKKNNNSFFFFLYFFPLVHIFLVPFLFVFEFFSIFFSHFFFVSRPQ